MKNPYFHACVGQPRPFLWSEAFDWFGGNWVLFLGTIQYLFLALRSHLKMGRSIMALIYLVQMFWGKIGIYGSVFEHLKGKKALIIHSSYCNWGHHISCLQGGTLVMSGVNGVPGSHAPSDNEQWCFYPRPLPTSTALLNGISPPPPDTLLRLVLIWLHRISELEIL